MAKISLILPITEEMPVDLCDKDDSSANDCDSAEANAEMNDSTVRLVVVADNDECDGEICTCDEDEIVKDECVNVEGAKDEGGGNSNGVTVASTCGPAAGAGSAASALKFHAVIPPVSAIASPSLAAVHVLLFSPSAHGRFDLVLVGYDPESTWRTTVGELLDLALETRSGESDDDGDDDDGDDDGESGKDGVKEKTNDGKGRGPSLSDRSLYSGQLCRPERKASADSEGDGAEGGGVGGGKEKRIARFPVFEQSQTLESCGLSSCSSVAAAAADDEGGVGRRKRGHEGKFSDVFVAVPVGMTPLEALDVAVPILAENWPELLPRRGGVKKRRGRSFTLGGIHLKALRRFSSDGNVFGDRGGDRSDDNDDGEDCGSVSEDDWEEEVNGAVAETAKAGGGRAAAKLLRKASNSFGEACEEVLCHVAPTSKVSSIVLSQSSMSFQHGDKIPLTLYRSVSWRGSAEYVCESVASDGDGDIDNDDNDVGVGVVSCDSEHGSSVSNFSTPRPLHPGIDEGCESPWIPPHPVDSRLPSVLKQSSTSASSTLTKKRLRAVVRPTHDELKMTKGKTGVQFGAVVVREYPMILGDHPFVSYGPPVMLGWNYDEYHPVSVDVYETCHPSAKRRDMKRMMMNYYRRKNVLTFWAGYTDEEIRAAWKIVKKEKLRRKVTAAFMPAMRCYEKVLGVKQFARSMRRKKKRDSSESGVGKEQRAKREIRQ